jgi:hypothetical protein
MLWITYLLSEGSPIAGQGQHVKCSPSADAIVALIGEIHVVLLIHCNAHRKAKGRFSRRHAATTTTAVTIKNLKPIPCHGLIMLLNVQPEC